MKLALLSDDREGIGMRSWIEVRYALRSEILKIDWFCMRCSRWSLCSEIYSRELQEQSEAGNWFIKRSYPGKESPVVVLDGLQQ